LSAGCSASAALLLRLAMHFAAGLLRSGTALAGICCYFDSSSAEVD